MQSNFNQQSNQRRKFRIRLYIGAAIILLLSLLILYVIVYSPIFQIKEFEIIGSERMEDREIVQIVRPIVLATKIKNFLGTKNLLAWKESGVDVSRTALLEAHISRDWLRQSVRIEVRERERIAIWCDSYSNCYWIDNNGIMFEEAPHVEGSLIITIMDESGAVALKGEAIAEERFRGNIITLIKKASDLQLPIREIKFHKKMQELRVRTYQGPDVYFSIRFDPLPSIASLQALKERVNFAGLQYIDLRVENRIYYK